MNNITEQVLQAVDIVVDEKISQLKYDKTVQAQICDIINLDTGEYKVRYSGNIFSAFANNLEDTYKIKDEVYVTIPEDNFSNKKIIIGPFNSTSLKDNQYTALQNAIFEVSPEFNILYGDNLYKKNEEFGVIAGAAATDPGSYNYICKGPQTFQANGFHDLFQQYANNYELIRIQAEFNTRFYDIHNYGNYGLEVEFYAKGGDIVSYKLDLNAFNGDPYRLNVYSPQSIVLKIQKNYLIGLKSIKLFEENFAWDTLYKDGQPIKGTINTKFPNIFVRKVALHFVEKRDLTDTNYYLTIAAPKGIALTNKTTPKVSSLELVGRLIYQGEDIIEDSDCECQWFVRDLSVTVNNENYNKEVGFGWMPLEKKTTNILTLNKNDIEHQQRYKLMVVYNKTVTLTAEIDVFNNNTDYNYHIEQRTEGDDISLWLISNDLKGDWYVSYPDGAYIPLEDGMDKDHMLVVEYLKYTNVIFYCSVHKPGEDKVIGTIEYPFVISESSEDVMVSFEGEDVFRYDANGDITIEDSERERTLKVGFTWKEGVGTAYSFVWIMRNSSGNEIELTKDFKQPEQSMIEKLWVDNDKVLHYNIKQKYKPDFNNNIVTIKITTITEEEYKFDKEILFVKDGDQGTNGTTYVIAVRPCDTHGNKLSGFQPLKYSGNTWGDTLRLKCYVYKDGDPITEGITYKWSNVNVSLIQDTKHPEIIIVNGQGNPITETSSAKLQFYVKVQADIDDGMNGNTSVYTSYPIDVLVGDLDQNLVNISSIPSYIKYSSSGTTPYFYNDPIKFIYNGVPAEQEIESLNTKVLDVQLKDDKQYLKPASYFIFQDIKKQETDENSSNIGILKLKYSDNQFIIHPVIMYLNVYGNEAINGWDGTKLDIDEKNGKYIFAPQIGAGEKNKDNTFTGVVMGKDSGQEMIGLYGYQNGDNTFGLKKDGTAFFGSSTGGGRIEIKGTDATIRGGNGGNDPNGMTITLANLNPDEDAIRIGNGVFLVTYNGDLIATNADITGIIEAKEGYIGCSTRHSKDGWHIETNKISSGSGQETVALSSKKDSYFRIWAGKTEAGTDYHKATEIEKDPDTGKIITTNYEFEDRIKDPAKFVVTKDGFVYMNDCYVNGGIVSEWGNIGGWSISKYGLSSGTGVRNVGLSSTGAYRFWSNCEVVNKNVEGKKEEIKVPEDVTNGYFYVDSLGKLNCRQATVRGRIEADEGNIGNWDITDRELNGDGITLSAKGGITINGGVFKVNQNGFLTATSGKIGNWNIKEGKLDNNKTGDDEVYLSTNGIKVTKNFQVDENGKLYAIGANFTGTISASQIEIKSSLSDIENVDQNITGTIGVVLGEQETTPTYNVGIKSSTNSIIVESTQFARVSGVRGAYLTSSNDVQVKKNNSGELFIHESNIYIGFREQDNNPKEVQISKNNVNICSQLTISNTKLECHIDAAYQTGIYARFAP